MPRRFTGIAARNLVHFEALSLWALINKALGKVIMPTPAKAPMRAGLPVMAANAQMSVTKAAIIMMLPLAE